MGCIICRNNRWILVETGIRHSLEGKIWRCVECGLFFQWPTPSADALGQYYRGEYRKDLGSRLAYKRFDRGMYEAERRFRQLPQTLNALEIGSGAGSFIYYATNDSPRKIDITGIEPDEASRSFLEQNYGIYLYRGLGTLPAGEKYDMIVMFHVLEHLSDPVGFLERLKYRLKPCGKIVVEVPNADDIMLRKDSYRKEYFYQKAHLWYFTSDTLQKVFQKAGLQVEINHIQRYNLRSHLRWTFQNRSNGDGNEEDLKQSVISRLYSKMLTGTGRSDTLWAIGG